MIRLPLRPGPVARVVRSAAQSSAPRRCISSAPPHRQSRSWKSSFARWGIAGGIVYYYNTSSVFADEPSYRVHVPIEPSREVEPRSSTAVIIDDRPTRSSQPPKSTKPTTAPAQAPTPTTTSITDTETSPLESPEALEEEASQQGAFNEETGEINWDCPCLGGMAYGPCGEQFRAAFSCFVYSKEDPKGVECIDHFKSMQNCFRDHPDIYGSELEEDEVAEGIEGQSQTAGSARTDSSHSPEINSTSAHANVNASQDAKKN